MKTPIELACDNAYKSGYEAAQPKWIPFSEGNPTEDEEYLVADENGVTVMTFCGGKWMFESGLPFPVPMEIGKDLTFTHWMPLPSPPKTTDNDNP